MKAFILIKLSLCYYHHKEAQKEKLGLIILLLLFPNVVHPTNICWRTEERLTKGKLSFYDMAYSILSHIS